MEPGRRRRQLTVGAGVGIGAFALAPSAEALVYDVDTTANGSITGCTGAAGDCSLRGALANSNGSGAVPDQITFNSVPSGSLITLATELPITDAVQVTGPGAAALTLSGADTTRIFNVNPAASGEAVEISGLTMTEGYGAIGGAIVNYDATLTVSRSIISNSYSGSVGGGIAHRGEDAAAGANNGLVDSTLVGNTAEDGGGLAGLLSFGFVESSTITGNEAVSPAVIGGTYLGGGINSAVGGGISDSTIAGNYAEDGGGGVFTNTDTMYPTALFNSIVADNTTDVAPPFGPDLRGAFNTAFSLVENTSGVQVTLEDTVSPGSLITGVDPQLGPLAANGGPTPTKRPAGGSPVVDKGGLNAVGPDQRDFTRPLDLATVANSAAANANGADMGSVELTAAEAALPPSTGTPAGTTPGTQPAAATKCKKKKKKAKTRAGTSAKCGKKKKKKK